MKIYFASDHVGFELKQVLKQYVAQLGHEVIDMGNDKYDPDDNFPEFVMPMAKTVSEDAAAYGIVCSGSGQGEAIAANKFVGARAVVYYGSVLPTQAVDISGRESSDPFEIIKLSRLHNKSNILSIGVRFVKPEEAQKAVEVWLSTPFSDQERYERRVRQIEEIARANGR